MLKGIISSNDYLSGNLLQSTRGIGVVVGRIVVVRAMGGNVKAWEFRASFIITLSMSIYVWFENLERVYAECHASTSVCFPEIAESFVK